MWGNSRSRGRIVRKELSEVVPFRPRIGTIASV